MLVASWSKSHQKVQKVLKVWNSCEDHRFGGTFIKAPILCQLDTRNLRALTVFRALFCWGQELSWYHVRSDYCQSKANGVLILRRVFSLEKSGRSSSQKHSSLSPRITPGLSTPKFLSTQHTTSLRYFSSGIHPRHFAIRLLENSLHTSSLCAQKDDVPAQD